MPVTSEAEPTAAPTRSEGASWTLSPSHASGLVTLLGASLAAFGVVMVYSSTSIGSELRHDDATLFLRKHVLSLALASIVFVLARTASLDRLHARAGVLLGVALVLLVLVLVPGVGAKVGGARRWIRVGPLNGQPSELAKLALVVFVAAHAAGRHEVLGRFRQGLLPAFIPVAVTAGLIALEPDMGTAAFVALLGLGLLVVAGVKLRHVLALSIPLALGALALAFAKLGYVGARIRAFLDPAADPDGVGYQARQAVIALGSGGPLGLGLGASRQKRLFLPDGHTDFVFAVVGEELGFVGAALLLAAFLALVLVSASVVVRARDDFRLLLGTGLAFALGAQAALNVAVATASVPPKGIALPLVSFGGSSLFFSAAALGLLANVCAECEVPRRRGEGRPW
jgi:cell division protein FtsW